MRKHTAPKKVGVGKKPTASSTKKKPLLSTQPRSKKDAAVQAGMFLHIDDNWSVAYFNDSDLHRMERELFG